MESPGLVGITFRRESSPPVIARFESERFALEAAHVPVEQQPSDGAPIAEAVAAFIAYPSGAVVATRNADVKTWTLPDLKGAWQLVNAGLS